MHVGRREHYRLAADLVERGPDVVALMQRSSTLVLGPEDGWDREVDFHHAVAASASNGTRWLHVTSIAGIERHLARASSTFPLSRCVTPPLTVAPDGTIVVASRGRADDPGSGTEVDVVYDAVKVLPGETDEALDWLRVEDFKADRQIRLVAAAFGERHEALVVSDLGDRQLTLRLDGPAAAELFAAARGFHERCPSLRYDALVGVVGTTVGVAS